LAVTSETFEESPVPEEADVSDESDELSVSEAEDELLVSASLLLEFPQPVNTHTLRVSAMSIAEIFFNISFFLSLLNWFKNDTKALYNNYVMIMCAIKLIFYERNCGFCTACCGLICAGLRTFSGSAHIRGDGIYLHILCGL
jgi:hypothetical protein